MISPRAMVSIAVGVTLFCQMYLRRKKPTPQHTSSRSGDDYMRETMLNENQANFHNVCRMDKRTFCRLVEKLIDLCGLKDTRKITSLERVMIFMQVLIGTPVRKIALDFQHSPSTISIIINEVSQGILKLKHIYLKQPVDGEQHIPDEMRDDPRFSPFFDNCIGAFDGSHAHCVPEASKKDNFVNHKSNISQNVFACVNLFGIFTFVLPGWEGSAHDGRVLQDAIRRGFRSLPGMWFLADAGYGLCSWCLTPFRGVRYHLKEWQLGNRRPQNAKELFNLRHSSKRNIIERTFGILKKRFPILVTMPSYPYKVQVNLILCCFIVHNFIKIEKGEEDEFDIWDEHIDGLNDAQDAQERPMPATHESARVKRAAAKWRQDMADAMWAQYQTYLEEGNE